MFSNMVEQVRNRRQLYLGKKVWHKDVYDGKEQLEVVGIKYNEIELKGDYSGVGLDNSSCWMPLEGVLVDSLENKGVDL